MVWNLVSVSPVAVGCSSQPENPGRIFRKGFLAPCARIPEGMPGSPDSGQQERTETMPTAGKQNKETAWPRRPALLCDIRGLVVTFQAFKEAWAEEEQPWDLQGTVPRARSASFWGPSGSSFLSIPPPTYPHPVTWVSLAPFHASSSWAPGHPWWSWTTHVTVSMRTGQTGLRTSLPTPTPGRRTSPVGPVAPALPGSPLAPGDPAAP